MSQAQPTIGLSPTLVFQQDVVVPACSCAHGRPYYPVLDLLLNPCLAQVVTQPYAEIRIASRDLDGHLGFHRVGMVVMVVVQGAHLGGLLVAELDMVPVGLMAARQQQAVSGTARYVMALEGSGSLEDHPVILQRPVVDV